MSIRVFDFRCPQGHVTERFVEPECIVIQCPVCNDMASRMIPAPRAKLEGITGSFPGAAMAWQRNRESHMAKERKHMASTGEYLNGMPVSDRSDS